METEKKPTIHIIAGVNGSGKTTIAYELIPNVLKQNEFLNADEIARGLSPFNFQKYNIEAGKILLNRFDELVEKKKSFVIEITLTSKVVNERLQNAKSIGYKLDLFYVWINSSKLAYERVKVRKLYGGHFINNETIIRRYKRSLINLNKIFVMISDYFLIVDNSSIKSEKIAERKTNLKIYNLNIWNEISEQ